MDVQHKTMAIKIDQFLDKKIGEKIMASAVEKEKNHVSSGKLSASKLGDPTQWQILYVYGVPQAPIDEYTYRKFLRGNHVEDWLLFETPNVVERQKPVEYRNVVGYIDAVVDTKDWDFPLGVLPMEIKSVSNMKFKKILKEGAQRGHKLQAGLYALALGVPNFAIAYCATDDYRVQTYIFDTEDIKAEIDEVITKFDEALEKAKQGIFPKFEAIESWQKNLEYCRYPEYMELTPEEIAKKIKEIKNNVV